LHTHHPQVSYDYYFRSNKSNWNNSSNKTWSQYCKVVGSRFSYGFDFGTKVPKLVTILQGYWYTKTGSNTMLLPQSLDDLGISGNQSSLWNKLSSRKDKSTLFPTSGQCTILTSCRSSITNSRQTREDT